MQSDITVAWDTEEMSDRGVKGKKGSYWKFPQTKYRNFLFTSTLLRLQWKWTGWLLNCRTFLSGAQILLSKRNRKINICLTTRQQNSNKMILKCFLLLLKWDSSSGDNTKKMFILEAVSWASSWKAPQHISVVSPWTHDTCTLAQQTCVSEKVYKQLC